MTKFKKGDILTDDYNQEWVVVKRFYKILKSLVVVRNLKNNDELTIGTMYFKKKID